MDIFYETVPNLSDVLGILSNHKFDPSSFIVLGVERWHEGTVREVADKEGWYVYPGAGPETLHPCPIAAQYSRVWIKRAHESDAELLPPSSTEPTFRVLFEEDVTKRMEAPVKEVIEL